MSIKAPNMARSIAARFASFDEVEAVVLAGSRTTGHADPRSDIDLYVYLTAEISLARRAELAAEFASEAEVGNAFWEPGDEWIDRVTGTAVDVMYRPVRWIEQQLDRVLVLHQASVGYSTCFWHNVLTSMPLHDRHGWFERLQQRANTPYPERLRRAIVAKNHPILRNSRSSYLRQIALALRRDDPISVQHRITALLASYFDILFALNRVTHPGEKRLVVTAKALCAKTPPGMERDIRTLLHASCPTRASARLTPATHALLEPLDNLLRAEGLLTQTTA